MKKLAILTALITLFAATDVLAQGGGQDPAVMAQRYKERVKPLLTEKVKLTDAEVEKILDIQLELRQQMRGFRDLSEDDRKKKMVEIQALVEKQYKAIPLTEDRIKAINEFFEEQRKNMQQRQGNRGN
jgi:hypothetical protein